MGSACRSSSSCSRRRRRTPASRARRTRCGSWSRRSATGSPAAWSRASVAAAAIVLGTSKRLIDPSWLQIIPVAGAALAFGLADPLGGSGFIAAFVAGMTFGLLRRPEAGGEVTFLTDELGAGLNGITLLVFGAVLLWPTLDALTWRIGLYAVASLTVVRMVPVALAMLGSRGQAADGRVSRLVRAARPRLDRLRGDRRPGGGSPPREHDPPDHLRHGRAVRPRPRGDGGTARPPLRRLVRIAPRRGAGDGERPGRPHRWRQARSI